MGELGISFTVRDTYYYYENKGFTRKTLQQRAESISNYTIFFLLFMSTISLQRALPTPRGSEDRREA